MKKHLKYFMYIFLMLEVHSISLIKVEKLLKILPYFHINVMLNGKRKLTNLVSMQYIMKRA